MTTLLLRSGRVIDPGRKVDTVTDVLIRDGRIAEVGPAASVRVPDGATRVSLGGKTLMPGLVNAHGHLSPVEGLRTGRMHVTKPLVDLLLEATDGLKGLVEAAKANAAPNDAHLGPLSQRLQTYATGQTAAVPAAPVPPAAAAARLLPWCRRLAERWTGVTPPSGVRSGASAMFSSSARGAPSWRDASGTR